MGVATSLGTIGRGLAVLIILAVAGPARLEAQVGLVSGAARITLSARTAPRGSIVGVSSVRETARRGDSREERVKIRLSANTGYRLVVLRTAAVSSKAEPATRL